MVNILIVVGLIVAGPFVGGGNSPGAYSQNPELAWPTAFSGQVAAGEWTTRSFDATGVQIKISLPSTWTVNSPATPGSFNAIDRANGLRLEIAERRPSSFALDKPVTGEQLAGSIRTMQTASPAGYVIEKAGQVRVGDRLWLWHESRIPPLMLRTRRPTRTAWTTFRMAAHATGRSPLRRDHDSSDSISL